MTNYPILIKQVKCLVEEVDKIAALSNITACINENMANINWVGFYFTQNDELVLGPFQGKVACTHIPIGKGVCGTAVSTKTLQLVDDVHTFQGHIACDSQSNSELVIPIIVENQVIAVLDVDSPLLNRFTEFDADGFKQIVQSIADAYKVNHWL